ncbi:MAG TPA: major capsid protein [Vitreimonas sp.]|uniref:major capsid protein n=1 Tax=Vitreimonas sp. TaxID=3069702 RepID=UPI002D5E0E8F|nr:major capsid protein [Vitreimonas sp.]HYD87118.1 major capsid protein [Vitreimonas sp.]
MDMYSTAAIAEVIRRQQRPQRFLLDLFFRNQVESDEEEIAFDIEINKQRVTPFVAAHVPGKFVEDLGYEAKTFKPAYVKDKRSPNPKRVFKRAIGETIGGAPQMTPAQREAALLNATLLDQQDMYYRRLELMAADALDDGITTVTGEGYATKTVDFSRPAGHTVTLTTTARWGETDVSPFENIEDWSATFAENSGVPVTDIVVDRLALRLLRADPKFEKAVDTTLRGTTASLDLTKLPDFGGQLVGIWNSTVRIWMYFNTYHDDAGALQKVLADYSVLLGNNGEDGAQTRCFGAIQDPEAGYIVAESFTKSKVEFDPGRRLLLMQGAPLPVLSRPAATFRARVR